MGRLWLPDTVAQQAATGAGLNNLAVSQRGAGANLSVDVASGQAWLNGHFYQSTAVNNLSIGANSSGSARVDRIVLRLDTSANTVVAAVLAGTPGAGAPALTQSIDGTWEISLAQVAVANGAASIVDANVTDERVRDNGNLLTLPGATSAYRFVGATASGAPVSGTFAVGDCVVDRTGKFWICTAAGTPGTWNYIGATSAAATAAVATLQTTNSGSYTDLATPGPAVTVTTNTKALVVVTAEIVESNAVTGYTGWASYAVSSATTVAAADAAAVELRVDFAGDTNHRKAVQASVSSLVTLTAGSNIFTMKYKTSGNTMSFANRTITVVPLN